MKVLLDALEAGFSQVAACGRAGIHPGTFCQWRIDFPDFSEQIDLAFARGNARLEAVIQRAAEGWEEVETTEVVGPTSATVTTKRVQKFSWQAALAARRSRHSEHWADAAKVQVEGSVNVPELGALANTLTRIAEGVKVEITEEENADGSDGSTAE